MGISILSLSPCSLLPGSYSFIIQRESLKFAKLVPVVFIYGWVCLCLLIVIDDDLGKSETTAEGWAGFQRLAAEVSLNHVGLILGVEMSRERSLIARIGINCWKSVPCSEP
jgi:hypothetical protein